MFTIEELKELIGILDKSSLERLELEQEGTKLILAKSVVLKNQEEPLLKSWQTSPEIVHKKLEQKSEIDLHKILSPVVGTFYMAAEPGAKPFVTIGQKVLPETVVGVVEVMKLFNEVEAQVEGEVIEILAKDGDFIEYGQPLFLIQTK
ncbi:acetyl-CoA carboxylase biotin carboxyl carrier protein [Propionispira arboris]|uniref:Biotin carboxyl carrier protein of acetyl-CoA carboxylase n=1 Tax=Propionispira arboris TaxID=84035 RepID=A0A1H6WT06_9FIRM|nr:biotin/lipoyl-containing protein [Propionispira arboris]SEJ19963.1 acetyl-CoA carboxylase biotin carboxyl carrier protein [Propionispira arboris]